MTRVNRVLALTVVVAIAGVSAALKEHCKMQKEGRALARPRWAG